MTFTLQTRSRKHRTTANLTEKKEHSNFIGMAYWESRTIRRSYSLVPYRFNSLARTNRKEWLNIAALEFQSEKNRTPAAQDHTKGKVFIFCCSSELIERQKPLRRSGCHRGVIVLSSGSILQLLCICKRSCQKSSSQKYFLKGSDGKQHHGWIWFLLLYG